MKDLSTLTNPELEDFFNSFDYILSDIDGVLRHILEEIPGSADAVKSLRKIDKKIILVTSNTVTPLDVLSNQLKQLGFDINEDDIMTPLLAMMSHLKSQNFEDKKIFVLGMKHLKEQLREAGFTVADNSPDRIEDSGEAFATHATVEDESIGCVIADLDFNLNYLNLQRAIFILENPEVIFLAGATDLKGPIGGDRTIVGPGYFTNIMEEITGRTALRMAKPSLLLNRCIVEKFQINDPSKVLFVGDAIPEDMGFGTNCNYKKLLVLSGVSKKEVLDNWTWPEELKPDFYVDRLGVVHELMMRIWGHKL